MSNILVIGGTGFVGTNLIIQLLKDGSGVYPGYSRHKIVSLDNYSNGKIENHQKGCIYYNVDIAEVSDYSFFMAKPDIIYHLAAKTRIVPSFEFPKSYFESNVTGTSNILEFAKKVNAKVIYAGSSSVHGDLYANPYTFTKWLGEELCLMYYRVFNTDVNICRFYNVYGPHNIIGGPYSTLIGIYQKAYKENTPLLITGDGEQRRDFTHVEDIVDGIIKCAKNGIPGEIYELGRGKNHSVNEVADMFGDKCEHKYIDARKGEIRETLCTYITSEIYLKWRPTHNLEDFIKEWRKNEKESTESN